MIRRLAPCLLLSLCAACATARLTGRPPEVPVDPGVPRVVVVEPFFEDADWLTKTRLDQEQVITSTGQVGMMTVERRYAEKPVFARTRISS